MKMTIIIVLSMRQERNELIFLGRVLKEYMKLILRNMYFFLTALTVE